jgi:branched-chain amino acid transport system ATP-binding protein
MAPSADTVPDTGASAGAATPVLEIRDLESGYNGTSVLRGLSLVVPSSSVVALIGPNGVGKTTLLRTVSGLVRATRGSIRLDGADITQAKSHDRARRGICHVPEGRGVFRALTVRENLVLQSDPGKEQEAIARATAAFPQLESRMNQTAGTMSGGEQQMLAMAQAYVRDARLILVDEASLGLAPVVVDIIFRFLGELASSGVSILIVDQYITRALDMADYAYIMGRGEILSQGNAAEFNQESIFEQYLGKGLDV